LVPFVQPVQTPQPTEPASASKTTESTATPVNRGGRPAEHDWDSFQMEIVKRANQPDGLPKVQAELIRDMLKWFSDNYNAEPAESAVKQRISKIYNYIAKGKNLPH
jgi:hypothetical protein